MIWSKRGFRLPFLVAVPTLKSGNPAPQLLSGAKRPAPGE